MVETSSAVRVPLALAHMIVEWMNTCRVSFEDQAAALDIAKRIYNLPRLRLMEITEITTGLASDVPTPNQSSSGIDHRAGSQALDVYQSRDN